MNSYVNIITNDKYCIPTIPYILDIDYFLTIENLDLEGGTLDFFVINQQNKKIVGKTEEILYSSKNNKVSGKLKSFITSYGDYELKIHLNNRRINSYSLSIQKGNINV